MDNITDKEKQYVNAWLKHNCSHVYAYREVFPEESRNIPYQTLVKLGRQYLFKPHVIDYLDKMMSERKRLG